MKEGQDEKRITGVMFYYFYVCKRKMWYFYHEIAMEGNHENVLLGKILDEEAYPRDEKHICIDETINIDFVRESKVLHEVKKSRKIEEASEWQVKYYIYYLKTRGVEGVSGRLDYPLLKKTKEVMLSEADEIEIKKVLEEIGRIVDEEIPPEFQKRNICKSCAYYDMCGI